MKQLLLTLFLLGTGIAAFAQGGEKQRQLEERKAEIQKEIKALNSLIKDQSSKEKSALSKLSENEARIELSEKLIKNTQKQTRLLTDDIYLNQLAVNKLNRELKVLKEDYAKMILEAYKSRSEQSRIMFILSSENFLEAYKRVQYMKQYASFRKVQGDEIRDKMTEVENRLVQLGVQKKKKEKLIVESRKEKDALEKDKDEQEKLVKTIRKDKKKYTAEVKTKQKESREIDRKIDRIIREAIAEANRKTAKKAAEAKATTAAAAKAATSTRASETEKIVLTKEGKVVSDNFTANKGRLPWPVEKGFISSSFGKHAHPYIDDVQVYNHGIDITTESNAPVRAVFGGEVSRIDSMRNNQKMVIIRHGNYLTVYINVENVSVSSGDKVSINQRIGTVGDDPEGRPVLKFRIMQNTKDLNPAQWIAR
nr:peptidoglycan DD-metalloendopeptidase family protein [uncultured Flavobacterium sp.]